MKAIEILLKQFENFVKRAMMPSVSFVFIFISVGTIFMYINNPTKCVIDINAITSLKIDSSFIYILLIVFIGFSFFLSILTQVFYVTY